MSRKRRASRSSAASSTPHTNLQAMLPTIPTHTIGRELVAKEGAILAARLGARTGAKTIARTAASPYLLLADAAELSTQHVLTQIGEDPARSRSIAKGVGLGSSLGIGAALGGPVGAAAGAAAWAVGEVIGAAFERVGQD
jgi:hypothetical protein